MELKVIHALCITPFEATLPAQSVEELLKEDYPRHVLIFPNGQEINLGYSYQTDIDALLTAIEKVMAAAGVTLQWEYKILKAN